MTIFYKLYIFHRTLNLLKNFL